MGIVTLKQSVAQQDYHVLYSKRIRSLATHIKYKHVSADRNNLNLKYRSVRFK